MKLENKRFDWEYIQPRPAVALRKDELPLSSISAVCPAQLPAGCGSTSRPVSPARQQPKEAMNINAKIAADKAWRQNFSIMMQDYEASGRQQPI